MASALILNAGTSSPLTISCVKAQILAPLVVGQTTNAFAGNERNAMRRELVRHSYTSAYLDSVTEDAVRRLFALGAVLPCSGVLFKGFIVSCAALVTSEPAPGVVDGSGLPLYTVTLAVREV